MSCLFDTTVFISYSSVDRPWVEQLARQLKSAGFSVFLDKWSIIPGRPWEAQINKALAQCDAGIVVLSPAAVASGMVNSEIDKLLSRALVEKQPLVPVLYQTCALSSLLSAFQYIDFRDTSDEGRARALISLIGALKGQPPGDLGTPTIPLRPPRAHSLRLLFVGLLILLMTAVAVRGVTSVFLSSRSLEALKAIQAEVQEIDIRVGASPPVLGSRGRAQYDYREEATGEKFASDSWDENGRLTRRRFYRAGRIVAEDLIDYVNGNPVRKVRQYFDADSRRFLTDTFVGDGTLVLKRYCPEFVEASCIDRVTDMVSPLPPAGVMGYR